MDSLLNIEEHPLEPFLPANAVLLMLGSFPPQKKRWSMDFFYPNLQNDMWRIVGLIFFQDKEHFLNPEKKVFDKDRIIEFLNDKGIALYDTASAIRRLQDNASDKFLEVIEQTDISLLLKQIPMCKAIVTTGQKATDIIREQIEVRANRRYKRTFRIWRQGYEIIQNAFFQPCLSFGPGKKSCSLSGHVQRIRITERIEKKNIFHK